MLRRLSLSRQKSTVQSPPPPGSPGGESPSGKHRRSVAATLNGIILKMPLGSGDIVKKGIVLKRGRNRLYHPWYLNSVVVTDQNLLLYFDGETLKGKVSLQGTSVRILSPQEITGKPYGLEISNVPSKKMLKEDRIVFVVGSEHEATEWLNAFETAQRMYMSRSTTKYESFGDMMPKQRSRKSLLGGSMNGSTRSGDFSSPSLVRRSSKTRSVQENDDEYDDHPETEEGDEGEWVGTLRSVRTI